ncbi:MAG: response regulator [Polyangiaceae bacterium]|nr:response regulator [Polyangiaceae bacterium]
MRWSHPAVRGAVVAVVFLGYPWTALALRAMGGEAALIVGVLPVAVCSALFGVRLGLCMAAVVWLIDGMLARRMHVSPETAPRAALITFGAYLVLAFGIGMLRRVWQRLGEVNRSLAKEVRLRGQMAAELEAGAALHSSLLGCMGEGVGLFDAEDRFIYANAAAERLFAVGPGELVGRCLRDLIDADGVRVLEQARSGQGDGASAYEFVTRAEGAEPRYFLVTETVLETPGVTEASILRVMHDVTVRQRLEREQRELATQVQRAQSVQSLGVLAGGVAHDFNNLLTGVLGNAELALLRLDRASKEEVRRCMLEIQEFAREAATLAKQMLAYAGKGTLVTEVLNVGDVAGEALRLVQSTVAARATLEQDVAPGLPNVRGDRTQLRQVVVNLIMNAVEALGDGRGTVRLSIEARDLDPDELRGVWRPHRPQSAEHVVLAVSDSGQGMTDETLAHIFDPFFSTKVAGRGMGLAATLGIVRAHGGSVGVESRPGGGSTFRVVLPPEHEPASGHASVVPHGEPPRGHGVILLIDDERAVRSAASQMLQELGYRVIVASSGREGLERLAEDSATIELVLLDLTMPEMDGRDTLLAIRSAGHTVPVLLTSGYHHGEVAQLLKEPRVVGFLQKPLQLERLANAVHNALRARGSGPHAVTPKAVKASTQ